MCVFEKKYSWHIFIVMIKKTAMKDRSKGIDKLIELIKDVKICMMITHHEEELKGRPMAATKAAGDGMLWFFSSSASGKYDDISHDDRVVLSYSDPSDNTYVLVNGIAEISRDRTKMAELWSPLMKAWFPDGLEDPHLILIRVEPEKAEYWDNSSSTMVVFFHMLKSVLTGKKYSEGEHGSLSL
jgi:general stress protein 26